VGVFVSLVFVAMEVRQNTEAVRSATLQAIAEQSFAAVAQLVEDEDLRVAYDLARGGQPLTPSQRLHLKTFYMGLMRIQQNRYMQAQLGILDLETLNFTGGRAGAYSIPFFAEFWSEDRDEYPPEFVEYIDRLLTASGF
jgi:hypothetical protein